MSELGSVIFIDGIAARCKLDGSPNEVDDVAAEVDGSPAEVEGSPAEVFDIGTDVIAVEIDGVSTVGLLLFTFSSDVSGGVRAGDHTNGCRGKELTSRGREGSGNVGTVGNGIWSTSSSPWCCCSGSSRRFLSRKAAAALMASNILTEKPGWLV